MKYYVDDSRLLKACDQLVETFMEHGVSSKPNQWVLDQVVMTNSTIADRECYIFYHRGDVWEVHLDILEGRYKSFSICTLFAIKKLDLTKFASSFYKKHNAKDCKIH